MKTQSKTPVSFVGKHVFTQDEKDQKLNQLLEAMREKEEIEAELKTTKSNYKSKIDAKDAEIKLTSNLLNSGFENRTYNCLLTKDFDAGKRIYTEIGTDTVVGTEPLTAADYQTRMDEEEAEIKSNNQKDYQAQQSAMELPEKNEVDENPFNDGNEHTIAEDFDHPGDNEPMDVSGLEEEPVFTEEPIAEINHGVEEKDDAPFSFGDENEDDDFEFDI